MKTKNMKGDDVLFEVRKLCKSFSFMDLVMPPMGGKPTIVAVSEEGKHLADYIGRKYKLDVKYLNTKTDEIDALMPTKKVTIEFNKDLLDEPSKLLLVDSVYRGGTIMKALQRLFPNSAPVVLVKTNPNYKGVYADYVAQELKLTFDWSQVDKEVFS
ncbi:MAG: hypothetical protein QXL94_01110 [Candidatus Parvarchaeum sp.]